jgi:hypothetical protein
MIQSITDVWLFQDFGGGSGSGDKTAIYISSSL